jgi:hypothetical protein
MMVETDRLLALLDYVEATERDRLPAVLDMADYRGFRRAGHDLIKLPGVLVNVRDGDDHIWLSVDRLVRRQPPPPTDEQLRLWIDLPDDVAAAPKLRTEIPDPHVPTADDEQRHDGILRLGEHPEQARLDALLAGYVREVWSPWVLEERPRRHAIDLYNSLFSLRQSLDGASEQPVELVWGVGIARWTHHGAKLNHPLLAVPMELTLDERTHTIVLRPRSESPTSIESGPLDALAAPSVDEWRKGTQQFFDTQDGEGLSPFEPESFAPVLRRAVALLDPDGHYLPDLGERSPRAARR